MTAGWEKIRDMREEDAIELAGPKGYIHGWIFVGAPGAEKPARPDDVQPHDLIRLAQKHAQHLPSGVHLSGATRGQLVKAIQKGQREEGKRPASPGGDAAGQDQGTLVRLAQKYATGNLPPGVRLSEATQAQLVAAIKKGQRAARASLACRSTEQPIAALTW